MTKSKMIRKLFGISLSLLLVLTMILAAGCDNIGGPKGTPEPSGPIIGNEDLEIISTSEDLPVINETDTIVVVNPRRTKSLTGKSRLSNAEKLSLVSLQGIVAQTKAEIYIGAEDDTLLQYIVEKYNKKIETIDDFKVLLDRYKSHLSDNGYIKIKYSTTSFALSNLNQACTIAGAEKLLLVPCEKVNDDPFEKAIQEYGLKQVHDLYYGTDNEVMVFDRYKDQVSKKMIAALHPNNFNSRDFGIANKAAFFFYRVDTTSNQELLKIYGSLNPLSAIVGWQDVVADVSDGQRVQQGASNRDWFEATSHHGIIAMPVSEIHNLSLFASIKEEGNLQQKDSKKNFEDGYHYVTVIMNDGGNIGEFIDSIDDNKIYANPDKANNPVGWTVSPSLYDYAPAALRYVYDNMIDNEHFIASVSGLAPANLVKLAGHNSGKTLDAFMNRTNDLLAKTGLKYITYNGNIKDQDVINKFGKLSNVQGGFILSNDFENPTGGVKWVDGKPFVADREVIRDATLRGSKENKTDNINRNAAKAAERLSQYEVNKSSIEGYSVVNIYSSNLRYDRAITNFYKKVDSDKVKIVTPDEFIELIKQNVEQKDVESTRIISTEEEKED